MNTIQHLNYKFKLPPTTLSAIIDPYHEGKYTQNIPELLIWAFTIICDSWEYSSCKVFRWWAVRSWKVLCYYLNLAA